MKRRCLLGTAAGTLASSLCGCTRAERSAGESSTQFERWLPSPATINADRYDFRYANIGAVAEHRDEFESDPLARYELQIGVGGPILRHLGVALEAFEQIVSSGTFAVAHGGYDRDTARAALESANYVPATETDGLEIFERDGRAAVGLGDDVVLGAGTLAIADGEIVHGGSGPESPATTVREIRDASETDGKRYTSDDPSLETLVARMGDGTAGWGISRERVDETAIEYGVFEGEEANGVEFTVTGETTDISNILVFAEEQDLPVADVERWLEAETMFADDTRDADYSIDVAENALVVSGSIETSELSALP